MYTPESRALFLPGAKSWQRRFRNVGNETLVKGFGGRTGAGQEKENPGRSGCWRRPGARRFRLSALPNARPHGGRRAQRPRRCTSGGRSRLSFSPGQAFLLARGLPGAPASKAGDPVPWAPQALPARERLLFRTGFLLLSSRTPGRGVGRWHHEAWVEHRRRWEALHPGFSPRAGVTAEKPAAPGAARGRQGGREGAPEHM